MITRYKLSVYPQNGKWGFKIESISDPNETVTLLKAGESISRWMSQVDGMYALEEYAKGWKITNVEMNIDVKPHHDISDLYQRSSGNDDQEV